MILMTTYAKVKDIVEGKGCVLLDTEKEFLDDDEVKNQNIICMWT